jgi:uncharacterized RDD family membrane protein YckC
VAMTVAAPRLLPGEQERGRPYEIVTPEGVPVRFNQATAGDRFGAFLIDFIVITVTSIAIWLIFFIAVRGESGVAAGLAILAQFLLQNFYFTALEIRWRGRTIGKRKLGLQVIDSRGGPLRAGAVFARNLTRNLELWLPMQGLLVPETVLPGAPGWMVVLAIAWMLVFALLPLFNRRRLRVGDMIAGTIVIYAPRVALLPDLGRPSDPGEEQAEPAYAFTTDQLDHYGIYELQVLEELLRDDASRRDAIDTVCEKIKRKIGWDRGRWEVRPRRFLMDFYAAQRRRLEQKMLMGTRKEHKEHRE